MHFHTLQRYLHYYQGILAVFCMTFFIGQSCTHLKVLLGEGFKKPEISLKDLKLVGVQSDLLLLKAELNVKNTNDMDLKLQNLTYNVHSGQVNFASGQIGEVIDLPRGIVKSVAVPISIQYSKAKRVLNDFLRFGKKPDIILTFSGEVFSDASFLRVNHRGSFNLKKVMP